VVDDDNGNPMESALRLTTARYYTPSGRTIHEVGITPDIGVPLTEKHEIELIRHGLFGDPYTGEDYRIPDPEEDATTEDEESPGAPVLQLLEAQIELRRQGNARWIPVGRLRSADGSLASITIGLHNSPICGPP
jgi:hypothetical protein